MASQAITKSFSVRNLSACTFFCLGGGGGGIIRSNTFSVGKNIPTRPLHRKQTFFKDGLVSLFVFDMTAWSAHLLNTSQERS